MTFRLSRLLSLLLCAAVLVFAAAVPAAALPPSEGERFYGVDVSEFQGEIDFSALRRGGIRAVYIRAGVGESYTDPYFHENFERAKAAGLYVGLYHYVTARSVSQGRRQAEFFASLAAGRAVDMRLAMDFESFGSLSVSEINSISREYLSVLTRLTGREAVIYSDTDNAINVFDHALAREYPLWAAQYGAASPSDNGKWKEWIGFQYSDAGRLPGIYGDVDRDIFTSAILLSDSSPVEGERVIPHRAAEKTTVIYVRAGDTLWSLARRYGTTVEKLVSENSISNPDLIYAGERLTLTEKARGSQRDSYTVKPGDTLTEIAGKFGVSVSALADINGKRCKDLIYAGERLTVPAAKSSGTFYVVRDGDTLSLIARREGVNTAELAGINALKNPDIIHSGQKIKLYEDNNGQ